MSETAQKGTVELLQDAWAIVATKVKTGDVEQMLEAIADYIVIEASFVKGETIEARAVRSLLKSSADSVRHAAFDYYASTK